MMGASPAKNAMLILILEENNDKVTAVRFWMDANGGGLSESTNSLFCNLAQPWGTLVKISDTTLLQPGNSAKELYINGCMEPLGVDIWLTTSREGFLLFIHHKVVAVALHKHSQNIDFVESQIGYAMEWFGHIKLEVDTTVPNSAKLLHIIRGDDSEAITEEHFKGCIYHSAMVTATQKSIQQKQNGVAQQEEKWSMSRLSIKPSLKRIDPEEKKWCP
ncbi:unnamed protein product [Cylindrotheca closterium]|uniref:Uncharacterized protein n=1 Tax=Cylindrotheca closterium TaxID=2856 RepID=A0AAD2PXZ3_9STRA|nr:unnamed protein product [Cylindrotheca closterium]